MREICQKRRNHNLIIACLLIINQQLSAGGHEYNWNSMSTRVYGGNEANNEEYPWIAHLRFYIDKNSTRYGLCGGFLIDDRHIMTAAHCIHDVSKKLRRMESIEVYLGIDDLTKLNRPHKVVKFFFPDNYDQNSLYNDIALLKLRYKVTFSDKIAPICLTRSKVLPYTTLTVAGYGRLGPNRQPAKSLMKVNVESIDKAKCNKMLRDYIIRMNPDIERKLGQFEMPKVHGSHICAVDSYSGADACSGDSGGPLMVKTDGDQGFIAVGIVSGAMDDCGDPRTPGFYTEISKFRSFIKKIAPKASFCEL